MKETLIAAIDLPAAPHADAEMLRREIRDVLAGVAAGIVKDGFSSAIISVDDRRVDDALRLKEIYKKLCQLLDDIKDDKHRSLLYRYISFLLFCFGELKTSDSLDYNMFRRNAEKAENARNRRLPKFDRANFLPQIELLDGLHPLWRPGRIAGEVLKGLPDSRDKAPSKRTITRWVAGFRLAKSGRSN